MSKPIRMTDEHRRQILQEFATSLQGAKLADGKISFIKTFTLEKQKATVYFTASAWTKMVMLIKEFDKEVAWHGVAYRSEDESKNEYYITDILVYPQEVTGATVNTDQERYQTWLYQHDDEVFNNIRMQGHSHVNMGVSPSGVDTTHQEQILEQLEDDMFYIFMIWNKSFNHYFKVYDMKKNILFESGDVDVKIADGGIGLDEFIKSAKDMVKNKGYTPGTYAGYNGNTYSGYRPTYAGNQPAATNTPSQPSKKEEPKKGGKGKKDKKKTKFSSQAWAGANACDEEEEKPDIYDLMQSSFDDSDDNPYLRDPFYAQ